MNKKQLNSTAESFLRNSVGNHDRFIMNCIVYNELDKILQDVKDECFSLEDVSLIKDEDGYVLTLENADVLAIESSKRFEEKASKNSYIRTYVRSVLSKVMEQTSSPSGNPIKLNPFCSLCNNCKSK